jgi:hypothetical protein
VLAHVGTWLGQARLGDRTVPLAAFGAVFTVPALRARGVGSRLLAAAVADARSAGAQLGLISGRRTLYLRQGFAPIPPTAFVLAAGGDGTATVSVAGPADAGTLAALYDAEPIRFVRPRADWDRLLASGTVLYGPGQILLVHAGARPAAYAAFQRDPVKLREAGPVHRAVELAGDRGLLADAVPALRAHLGGDHPLGFVALPHDRALAGEADRRGWPAAEVQLGVSAARWDPALAQAPLPWYGLNYL